MMQIKVIDPAVLAAAAERNRTTGSCLSPVPPRAAGHGAGKRRGVLRGHAAPLSPQERARKSDAAEVLKQRLNSPKSPDLTL